MLNTQDIHWQAEDEYWDQMQEINLKQRRIMWNANLMQQGKFIDVFLVPHVSATYAHHQEH